MSLPLVTPRSGWGFLFAVSVDLGRKAKVAVNSNLLFTTNGIRPGFYIGPRRMGIVVRIPARSFFV